MTVGVARAIAISLLIRFYEARAEVVVIAKRNDCPRPETVCLRPCANIVLRSTTSRRNPYTSLRSCRRSTTRKGLVSPLNVPAAYESLVVKGFMTELLGSKIIKSPRVAGDNTDGYHCIAANRNWLTFADKVLQVGIEEDQIGNFGSAFNFTGPREF
jgi:hypothetical protein